MATLEQIVRVTISLNTAGIRQQTFSDLLLLGAHDGPDRVTVITAADDLLDDSFGLDADSVLYRAAQVAFSQIPGPFQVFVGRRDTGESATEALAACLLADTADRANRAWYGVVDVNHSAAEMIEIAQWCEANQRLFFAVTNSAAAIATAGVIGQLVAGQFYRTAWFYHADPDAFPEVAAAARLFTIPPGGETWANKQLAAVPALSITPTLSFTIQNFNGNSFEPIRNLAITQGGHVAAGEWIDIIRFRDWQCEEIRTRVFDALINKDKVPFTDPGIAMLRQPLMAALDLGVRRGGIAPPEVTPPPESKVIPSYTTSVPASVQISTVDKAARVLRDMRFTARLAGAIHAIEIRGSLTYSPI